MSQAPPPYGLILLISSILITIPVILTFHIRNKFRIPMISSLLLISWFITLVFLILEFLSNVMTDFPSFVNSLFVFHVSLLILLLTIITYIIQKKKKISIKKVRDIILISLVGILTFTFIGIIALDLDTSSRYEDCMISVEFYEGVNETEARDVIGLYNLTIIRIDDNEPIWVVIEVPVGQEDTYVNILSNNLKIHTVERSREPV